MWGEFRIGDLFEHCQLKGKPVGFDKTQDVSKVQTQVFSLPLVNAKLGNNGIMYYGRPERFDSEEMTIGVIGNGEKAVGLTYAQPQRTGVFCDAYLIKPKWAATKEQLLFLSRAIEKVTYPHYTYQYKATWSRVQHDIIKLPVKDGEIDFVFMDNFIRTIEENARQTTPEYAKMVAKGDDDILLTQDEINALSALKSGKVTWGEFRIGDLFTIGTGSLVNGTELASGSIPRISAKSDNNGIIGHYSTESLGNARHEDNFISVNFFGAAGGIFYHPYKASVEMKVHTLKIPGVELTKETGTFLCAALNKTLVGFDYCEQLSSSKLKKENYKIKLPVKDGEIDFTFMENLISAIEKQSIADVRRQLNP